MPQILNLLIQSRSIDIPTWTGPSILWAARLINLVCPQDL